MAKTYEQYCPVAAGLDHVGDRWTTLIVRDLVWYGPARFTDFIIHNEGIPPALLTERLRTLETAGFVTRDDGVYRINDPEGALRALVDGLAAFGMTLLVAEDPSPKSLEYLARRVSSVRRQELADTEELRINVTIGATAIGVEVGHGAVSIVDPFNDAPTVSTTVAEFARLVTGRVSPSDLTISADRDRVAAGLELLRLVA